jgi:hypothetical protein
MRLAFFVDANLEPNVSDFLEDEGYRAEYSDYVLDEDADDEDDILPYVRRQELLVVTATVKNFAAFDESRHEGVSLSTTSELRPPILLRPFSRWSTSTVRPTI